MCSSRLLSLGLVFSILCSSAFADIYKTVDKEGRVTYSDVPPPNSNVKPVELKSLNTTPPPVALPEEIPANPVIDAQEYNIRLIAPENGTTLLANERSINIAISLNRVLQNGDRLAYKLDGNTIATSMETSFNYIEPPRGEHSISVDVIDSNNKSLARSEPVNIIVLRPIVKQPVAPVPKK